METLTTAPLMTFTDAVPQIVPLAAFTVLVNAGGVAVAVNRPFASIDPPPASTDQVGETATATPWASRPTAMNCCVVGMASCMIGVTTMLASGPAGAATSDAH